MWNYSSISDSWEKKVERLDKRIYNYLRQEIEDVRFYSKCLDGISYMPVADLSDIHDVLKFKDDTTYKINKSYSSKFTGTDISGGSPISSGDLSDVGMHYRYNQEYGYTLKNLFTPRRLIDDSTNYLEVDVATTEQININQKQIEIDGVRLKEGHRVLVKNNITNITLDSSIDPGQYFSQNYYFVKTVGASKTYYYFNSQNGIYKYTNGQLVRENDLDEYLTIFRYSVHVKLGSNSHKQYHLSRLRDGNFPLTSNNDPIEFVLKKNHIVRNSLEYRNTLDNEFYAGYVQKAEAITVLGKTYQIPSRFVAVGDFGFIVNNQDNYSNIIKNKFKRDFKDISSVKDKYYIIGDNGTLLSLDKISMEPSFIDLEIFDNLKSIDFIENKRGIIVGERGTILLTRDQYNWTKINTEIDNNLNKVIFKDLSSAYIVGDNGVLKKMTINKNNSKLEDIELSVKSNLFDQKRVYSDFYDVDTISINKETFKYDGSDWVDIEKSIGSSDFSFDFRFKPTDVGTGSSTLFSFFTEKYPITTGPTVDKGVKIIIEPDEKGVQRLNMYVNIGENSTGAVTNIINLKGNINIENDSWYHVMVTRDKGRYQLYVNQKLSDSTNDGFDGNFDDFNNRIRLGAELTYTDGTFAYSSTSYNHFKGVIDQVRLFNKNLDDDEAVTFANNYLSNLDGLIAWYKFNAYNETVVSTSKVISTTDVISGLELILPTPSNLTDYNTDNNNTDGIDIETFTGILATGDDVLAIVLNVPTNYSKQVINNQFFIYTDTDNARQTVYNNIDKYFYGIGDNVYRINSENIEFDLFNQINVIEVNQDQLIETQYNSISLCKDTQTLYLISGDINEISRLDIASICDLSIHDPLANCSGVYVTVSTIRSTNSLTIENDYINDVTDSENINSIEYIKTLGYPSSTQSVVKIPIGLSGSFLDPYTELYCSFSVSDLSNGYLEISLDDFNFTPITANGDYLIPTPVGSSILTVRAVLDPLTPIGNKVKGTIKNIVFYQSECVQLIPQEEYDGGTNIQKLYFSQFDTQSQLEKITNGDALYSYIDLKSLKVNGVEKIDLATYSVEGFPKYLYPEDISTLASSRCDIGGLCNYISYLSNPVLDRIRYGFGLTVSINNYQYIGNSYGLLEGVTINTNQIFGIDKSSVNNEISSISNPYHVGIDLTKSFRFEVDSMIISSDDLLFTDLTNGNGATVSPKITIDASTISYGTASGNYFNEIGFTGSTSLTYSIVSSEINVDQLYYVEMILNGDISVSVGTQSFTFSGTGSIVKQNVRIDSENSGNTSIDLTSSSTQSTIYNFVFTDRLPTKNIIEWDPAICKKSYRMSGIEEEGTGYLLGDGSGEYQPSCSLVLTCDNEDALSPVVDETYWEKYTSKLLFLNYDIASKLYFFDTNTGEYQLPNSVIISDVNILAINSISGQKSWLDYSKDTTKEFGYLGNKNEANTIKYSSTFTKTSPNSSSYDVILNGNATNDISDINGATQGLLPNFDSGTVSLGVPSVATYSYYFYKDYMIFKKPSGFTASAGDIIRMENGFITENLMVIYILTSGSDTYVYLKTTFNQSITNRLKSWTKTTTITNLNKFQNTTEIVNNFNLHPISVGYELSVNSEGNLQIDPKFNFKTAYYNLQCRVSVTNDILDVTSQNMVYINKVLSFGYTPTYNILDYLSKNPTFTSSYKISILPQYTFTNDNAGVLYTVSDGLISFNSAYKSEWESIPKYMFVDITFGADVLSPVLVTGKYYDSDVDRYIIETYNYYGYIYDQGDLNDATWTLRVRNTLGELSSDLQKMNNIQRSESTSYHITDLSNNIYTTYNTLKSELNFKPNTDNYAKALLNQKEIKEYLSGLIYTDHKNELAVNMINLPKCDTFTVSGISEYYVDCPDCIYEDYAGFTNPLNNIEYNQYAVLGGTAVYTYYTNRVPPLKYDFYNNIIVISATGGTYIDVPIDFVTQSGTDRVLEFIVEDISNANVQVVKDNTVINTISYIPYNNIEPVKTLFEDNGVDDLIIRINYTAGTNKVDLTNIRVGGAECISNCYLTRMYVENHGLSVGDGIYVDIEDTIYNLENLYHSEFNDDPLSGWVKNISGITSSVTVTNDVLDIDITSPTSIYLPDSFSVSSGETYRITFDYLMTHVSGTPSISPSFGTASPLTLNNNFETLYHNSAYTNVVSNFIPTGNSIYIGFNFVGNANIKLSSISIDKITDVGEYYDGYQVVQEVINSDEIVINTTYNGMIEEISATYSYINACGDTIIAYKIISDLGIIRYCTFDPYLNYEPIDIFELGKDDKIKQAIEIKPNDWKYNEDNTVSIVDTIDMNNYRFRLIDGLSIVDLNEKYSWILESEIRKALIGKDSNGIVWYKGIWDCGRWFGGTWYSGDWRNGEWYGGTWNNSEVEDNVIKAEVKVLKSNYIKSIWHNGNFREGTWNGGKFRSGNHYGGTWSNGQWVGGIWHDGLWQNGSFNRGTWIDGTWEKGTFNCLLGQSSWFDGLWNGGTFGCGRWYDGTFNSTSYSDISTFGSQASLSKPAIWESGRFIYGIMMSGSDNERDDRTIWKTGYWNNGIWDGGTAYKITWNNGTWNGGVVKDIDVVAFFGDINGSYIFTLKGDWKFKRGDTFWVIDNGVNNPVYGSDTSNGQYKVDVDYITINNGEYTKVLVDKVPTALQALINTDGSKYAEGYLNNDIPTDDTIDPNSRLTKIVSHFSKASWYNGQFKNGIFDGTFFRDGIFENGVFKSGDFGY